MANPVMRMGFREPTIDTNRPLVDGTVGVEGFEVEVSDFRGAEHIDAWDASFGGLMQTKAAGNHPYVSIPAFPNRQVPVVVYLRQHRRGHRVAARPRRQAGVRQQHCGHLGAGRAPQLLRR